jgi:RNA-directed DNA polymerase
MGWRVQDGGKSERCSVMEQIGVAPYGNITPRESGQTSTWSLITRELDQSTKEATQMTTAAPVGAASHAPLDWHAINWRAVHRNVRRLQARIVKAEQEGRRGKVKALQRLLTRSFSGRALAVRRVTENQGKRTPGVDGETWNTPHQKATALHMLRPRPYRVQPLRRVYIAKKNGKRRPLSIPTLRDRAMQALYLLALAPLAEVRADPNSYGFRLERSSADALEQCFITLAKRTSPEWVLEGDIAACFDHISHDWLLAHIPIEPAKLRSWLKAGYMEQHILFPTEEGAAQGGIISPTLANLALDGLERQLRQRFPKSKTGCNAKVNLIRFADDFIITGRSKEVLEQEVKPLVEDFLRERGLSLSEQKTQITHIEDGFDFLGQNVRKYNGKLLIKPSKHSIQTLLAKVREVVKAHKQAPAEQLIARLNPIIRGWAHYHRHGVSGETFRSIDHAIWQVLWRWAKRRHPTKPRRWVRKKYFRTQGDSSWVFYGEKDGQHKHLFRAVRVPIERHRKVKGEANPFDPAWEVYFEQRLAVKVERTLTGKRQLLCLWKEQNGICPICGERITELTGWHNHHIRWRCQGGTDGAENRVLLHPNCHQQVHSQKLTVQKPRS